MVDPRVRETDTSQGEEEESPGQSRDKNWERANRVKGKVGAGGRQQFWVWGGRHQSFGGWLYRRTH
jgi:hypothetical protein